MMKTIEGQPNPGLIVATLNARNKFQTHVRCALIDVALFIRVQKGAKKYEELVSLSKVLNR